MKLILHSILLLTILSNSGKTLQMPTNSFLKEREIQKQQRELYSKDNTTNNNPNSLSTTIGSTDLIPKPNPSSSNHGTTPKELADLTYSNSWFIHPSIDVKDEYLLKPEANKIIDEMKINLKIYLINEISAEYNNPPGSRFKKNIEKFVNDLTFLTNKDKEFDKNSLFILISVKDRQIRIRTGEDIKKKITNDYLYTQIRAIGGYFRKNEFTQGIKYLLEYIAYQYKWGNTIFYSILVAIISFLALYFFYQYRKTKDQESAVEKLNKLKEKLKKKQPVRQFLDKTCVICLEEFDGVEESGEVLGDSKLKEKVDRDIEGKEINEISSNPKKDIKKSLNSECSSPFTTLQCGHRFHDECIKSWMDKQNNCPTCRHKIDEDQEDSSAEKDGREVRDTTTNSNLGRGIIQIQGVYYPDLLLMNITYGANDINWVEPVNIGGGAGSSSLWDIAGGMGDVGGASGGW